MKKSYYTSVMLSFVAALLFFTSCKKESVIVSGVPAKTYLIKTFDYSTGVRTNVFDLLERIIHVGRTDGSSAKITYTNDKVESQTYKADGTPGQKDIFTIEPGGLMISATNSINLPLVCTFTYNSDRQVTSQTNSNNGNVVSNWYYTYSNGNRILDSMVSGNAWHVSKYEYYTDIISTLENDNWGDSYLGKGNRNAVKKEVYMTSSGTGWTKNYERPVLDDLFRIVKTSFSIDGAAPVTYLYTYY